MDVDEDDAKDTTDQTAAEDRLRIQPRTKGCQEGSRQGLRSMLRCRGESTSGTGMLTGCLFDYSRPSGCMSFPSG
jgi:hypothetical protein